MKIRPKQGLLIAGLSLGAIWSCSIPQTYHTNTRWNIPSNFTADMTDSTGDGELRWREFFRDSNLISLIDSALKNNQELKIMQQEIEISRNEIRARKGEYLPFAGIGAGAGAEKSAEFTRNGAVDEQLDIIPGQRFPKPLGDFGAGLYATWEIDIWKKLHNARQAAVSRYLASVEGRNFMITGLVAEIASSYFELQALDNTMELIEQNIIIQSNALKTVKLQKESAKVTQLAVNRFEAQLLNTRNLQYAVRQRITETENRINYLTGRFQGPVRRESRNFLQLGADSLNTGIPSAWLRNRPDILQAEHNMAAARLDVDVARAKFYPSLGIHAGMGFQAFNPAYLVHPESMAFNLAGDLIAPLVNRNAIQAAYNSAKASQIQAVVSYEQTVISAFTDVLNQISRVRNYSQSYEVKKEQVDILKNSVVIAGNLFNSARADYAEVLLTQREALEAKMDLIEIKLELMKARVNIYRALGGGWK